MNIDKMKLKKEVLDHPPKLWKSELIFVCLKFRTGNLEFPKKLAMGKTALKSLIGQT